MRRLACSAATLAALVAPAAAQAGFVTIGSDLSQTASIAQSHTRDWAAWPTAFDPSTSGSGIVSPVKGEVTQVTFKGTVLKPTNPAYARTGYPPFNFKVAILRPQGDGSVKFVGSTFDLDFPFGGDEQRVTTFAVNKDSPIACVEAGDIVALATSGGFGSTSRDPSLGAAGGMPDDFFADGYQVQMFGRVPGSSVSVFEQPAAGSNDGNGFQVGDVERGTGRAGQELLMQAKIGTEEDARSFCRTPKQENQATRPKVTLPEQAFRLVLSAAGTVPLQLGCVSVTACTGTAYLKAGTAPVGTAPFSIASGATGTVAVKVNANGLRKLKERKGKLAVTLIVRPKGGARVEQAFKLVKKPARRR